MEVVAYYERDSSGNVNTFSKPEFNPFTKTQQTSINREPFWVSI